MRLRTLVTPALLVCACGSTGDSSQTNGDTEGGSSTGSPAPSGSSVGDPTTQTDSGEADSGSDGSADSSDTSGSDDDSTGTASTTGGPSGPFEPSCPPPDLDNVPEWVPAPGSWGEISLDTMWDHNPCPNDPQCSWSANLGQRAVLTVWNGGAFACHEGELGSLVEWGGGHNGYWGNEVYVYDLATRLWQRRTDPNPNPIVTDPDNGELDDGTPSVLHTYENLVYHPGTNSLVVLQGQAVHNQASSFGAGHMFSLTDNAWRRNAIVPNSGYGNSAYDGEREIIWGSSQGSRFFSFDPRGDADANGRYGVAVDHHHASIGLDTVAAIDPNNDIYVLADLRSDPPSLLIQDLTDPGADFVAVTIEGPMPSVGAGGFEWVSSRQQFYWYGEDGNDIRTLEVPDAEDDGGLAGDWRTTPWRWTQITAQGVGPGPRTTGTYGGWAWAPAIQSFVIINDVQDSVFAFRPE